MVSKSLLIVFLVLTATVAARGQIYFDNSQKPFLSGAFGEDMRSAGMAGAVDALSFGVTGIANNPAGMPMVRQYTIEGGYNYLGGAGAHTAHFAVVDTQTNPYVGAGVAYSFTYASASEHKTKIHAFNGALSGSFGTKALQANVGLTFKYRKFDFLKDKDTSGLTFNAGFLLSVNGTFHTAIVARNLKHLNKYTPRRVEIGTGATYRFINVDFDLDFDFDSNSSTTTSFAFGAEFLFSHFAIRAGFNYDKVAQAKVLAAGFGFSSQRVGFNIGYQHDVSNLSRWLVGLDLEVFLH